jgi:hypothetical protein
MHRTADVPGPTAGARLLLHKQVRPIWTSLEAPLRSGQSTLPREYAASCLCLRRRWPPQASDSFGPVTAWNKSHSCL